MITRRFLVAPALVRLIRHYRGSTFMTEGHFEQQSGRSVLLRIKGAEAHLILSTSRPGEDPDEVVSEIPTAHADVLLTSCAGRISFEQSSLALADGQEVLMRRYTGLTPFATVSVAFPDGEVADRFAVPFWFGSEVTDDEAYGNRALALKGLPRPGEISISDVALNAVMDLLERETMPMRMRPTAQPESASRSKTELPPETLSALTSEMARALSSTTEDAPGENAGSADSPQDQSPSGLGRLASQAA